MKTAGTENTILWETSESRFRAQLGFPDHFDIFLIRAKCVGLFPRVFIFVNQLLVLPFSLFFQHVYSPMTQIQDETCLGKCKDVFIEMAVIFLIKSVAIGVDATFQMKDCVIEVDVIFQRNGVIF